MDASRRLETYLNDHLAGSTVALDVARRRVKAQGDDEFGAVLRVFADEVAEDQEVLRRAMAALGASPRLGKELVAAGTAWLDSFRAAIDSAGSPNLVRDLELLIMGVQGKQLLWESLERLEAPIDDDLGRLRQRARDQIAALHHLHARAVDVELGSG